MARAAKPGGQPAGGAKAQSLERSNALAQIHESNRKVLAEAKSHAENAIAEFYQNNTNLNPQTPEQRYCVPETAPTKVLKAAAFLSALNELERVITQSPECQSVAELATHVGIQAIELQTFEITNKPHDAMLQALQKQREGNRRGGKFEPVWGPIAPIASEIYARYRVGNVSATEAIKRTRTELIQRKGKGEFNFEIPSLSCLRAHLCRTDSSKKLLPENYFCT